MNSHAASRRNEVIRIKGLIQRRHFARLQMMAIVALTGAVGFLASFTLLRMGVDAMWLRYPAAVATAYVAFLFFLWCWLRSKRNSFLDELDYGTDAVELFRSVSSTSRSSDGGVSPVPRSFEAGGGRSGGGGASSSLLGEATRPSFAEPSGGTSLHPEPVFASAGDTSSGGDSSLAADAAGALDVEEGVWVVVAIVALVGAVGATLWIVWAAPALLAELLLDAALAAGLYGRLRKAKGDHWLRTAIRLTGWRFVAVAVLFALAGAAMQAYAPNAKSVGEVIQYTKTIVQ